MRKYITRYKAGSILLIASLLMFSACAKENEDFSANQTSEDLISASPRETEETPMTEVLSVKPTDDMCEPTVIEVNWEDYFEGINGAAVVYSPTQNRYQIYNQELAHTRQLPCSTFKIISSLIGLENGIIDP